MVFSLSDPMRSFERISPLAGWERLRLLALALDLDGARFLKGDSAIKRPGIDARQKSSDVFQGCKETRFTARQNYSAFPCQYSQAAATLIAVGGGNGLPMRLA